MAITEKIVQRSGAVDTVTFDENGTLTVKMEHNVDAALAYAAKQRNEAQQANLVVPDSTPWGFKVASIPPSVIQTWKHGDPARGIAGGFDLLSAANSGMTEEEHHKELMKRLSGDWAGFNVSKYRKL